MQSLANYRSLHSRMQQLIREGAMADAVALHREYAQPVASAPPHHKVHSLAHESVHRRGQGGAWPSASGATPAPPAGPSAAAASASNRLLRPERAGGGGAQGADRWPESPGGSHPATDIDSFSERLNSIVADDFHQEALAMGPLEVPAIGASALGLRCLLCGLGPRSGSGQHCGVPRLGPFQHCRVPMSVGRPARTCQPACLPGRAFVFVGGGRRTLPRGLW
jgi:hypothetical protein